MHWEKITKPKQISRYLINSEYVVFTSNIINKTTRMVFILVPLVLCMFCAIPSNSSILKTCGKPFNLSNLLKDSGPSWLYAFAFFSLHCTIEWSIRLSYREATHSGCVSVCAHFRSNSFQLFVLQSSKAKQKAFAIDDAITSARNYIYPLSTDHTIRTLYSSYNRSLHYNNNQNSKQQSLNIFCGEKIYKSFQIVKEIEIIRNICL